MKSNHKYLTILLLTCSGSSALAADSTSYRYDALGRLTTSAIAANGTTTSSTVGYDPAGNRTAYKITGASGSTPSPTAAPVARNPAIAVRSGSITSIALSTLATTSSAATIANFTPPSGAGSGAIAADRQSIVYTAPSLVTPGLCDLAYTNLYSTPYSVQNAAGAATGTATISVTSAAGPRPRPPQVCP
jgi:hypothetical protein